MLHMLKEDRQSWATARLFTCSLYMFKDTAFLFYVISFCCIMLLYKWQRKLLISDKPSIITLSINRCVIKGKYWIEVFATWFDIKRMCAFHIFKHSSRYRYLYVFKRIGIAFVTNALLTLSIDVYNITVESYSETTRSFQILKKTLANHSCSFIHTCVRRGEWSKMNRGIG